MDSGEGGAQRAELAAALRSGRLHGAYLLQGRAGAGPARTGFWFARLLLCAAPGDEPCERCHGCTLTRGPDAPRHPDLHLVRPEPGAALRVDAVRELQAALCLAAHQGGRRVGLIFDAERLNLAAANALLKTLEEPPSGAVLVLVAREAAALPPTVRSRLLRLCFAPESEASLRAALEAEGAAPEQAELAAALGGGSRESAREWLAEHGAAAAELHAELAAALGPPVHGGAALELAERFRGAGAREPALLFLDVYGQLARGELRRAAQGGDAGATAHWLGRIESGQYLRRELEKRNLNPQLAVESLLLGTRQRS